MVRHIIVLSIITLILYPSIVSAVPVPDGAKTASEYIIIDNKIVYEVYYVSAIEGCVWGTGYIFSIEGDNIITCEVYKLRNDGWYKGRVLIDGFTKKVVLLPTEAPPDKEYDDMKGYVVCKRKLDVRQLQDGKYAYLRTMKITFDVYEESVRHIQVDSCTICSPPLNKYIELPKGMYIAYVGYNPDEGTWDIYLSFDLTENEEVIDSLPLVKVFSDPKLTLAYVTKVITHLFKIVLGKD